MMATVRNWRREGSFRRTARYKVKIETVASCNVDGGREVHVHLMTRGEAEDVDGERTMAIELNLADAEALIDAITKHARWLRGQMESSPPTVFDGVFRDPAEKSVDSWRVIFCGEIQTPAWRDRGGAEAFLSGLRAAAPWHRKPEVR